MRGNLEPLLGWIAILALAAPTAQGESNRKGTSGLTPKQRQELQALREKQNELLEQQRKQLRKQQEAQKKAAQKQVAEVQKAQTELKKLMDEVRATFGEFVFGYASRIEQAPPLALGTPVPTPTGAPASPVASSALPTRTPTPSAGAGAGAAFASAVEIERRRTGQQLAIRVVPKDNGMEDIARKFAFSRETMQEVHKVLQGQVASVQAVATAGNDFAADADQVGETESELNEMRNRYEKEVNDAITRVLQSVMKKKGPGHNAQPNGGDTPPAGGDGEGIGPFDDNIDNNLRGAFWHFMGNRALENLVRAFFIQKAWAEDLASVVMADPTLIRTRFSSLMEAHKKEAGSFGLDRRGTESPSSGRDSDDEHLPEPSASSAGQGAVPRTFYRPTAKSIQESAKRAIPVMQKELEALTSLLATQEKLEEKKQKLDEALKDAANQLADASQPLGESPGGASGSPGGGEGTGGETSGASGSGGGGGGSGNGGGGGGEGNRGEPPKPGEFAQFELPPNPLQGLTQVEPVQPVEGLGPRPVEERFERGAVPNQPPPNFPLSIPQQSRKLSYLDRIKSALLGKPSSSLSLTGNATAGNPFSGPQFPPNDIAPNGVKPEVPGSAAPMPKSADGGNDGVFANLGGDGGGDGRTTYSFSKEVAFGSGETSGPANTGNADALVAKAGGLEATKDSVTLAAQIKSAKAMRGTKRGTVKMLGIMAYVGTFGEMCGDPKDGKNLGICQKPRLAKAGDTNTAQKPPRRNLAGSRDGERTL